MIITCWKCMFRGDGPPNWFAILMAFLCAVIMIVFFVSSFKRMHV